MGWKCTLRLYDLASARLCSVICKRKPSWLKGVWGRRKKGDSSVDVLLYHTHREQAHVTYVTAVIELLPNVSQSLTSVVQNKNLTFRTFEFL